MTTLDDLRARLRGEPGPDVPVGETDRDGYIRLPDFDGRKTFGLDHEHWFRTDWQDAKQCERYGSPCGPRRGNVVETAPFPALRQGQPDKHLCVDCACRWADMYTKLVTQSSARARLARRAATAWEKDVADADYYEKLAAEQRGG